MRGFVTEELAEHAEEEFEHAEKLAERILQLGGTPLINPTQWLKQTNCKYEEPTDPNTKTLLEQNIKGEQCAIGVYQKLYKMVEGKDPITAQMVLEILTDEVEHEEDLEAILDDMETKIF